MLVFIRPSHGLSYMLHGTGVYAIVVFVYRSW